MASVNSRIRSLIKPVLFKLFPIRLYKWFQFRAKIKDIDLHLVDEKEMEIIHHFIQEADTVIDIGANYAYYTVPLSKLAKKVYAYEPIPFTYDVCKMLVKHYKLKNVVLHQKGVGERNEVKQFSVPTVDFGALSAGQAHFKERNNELEGKERHHRFNKSKSFDCIVESLDKSLLNKIENLSFVKMDIEGAELFALKGMTKIIEKFKPVILIEINPFFLAGFNISEIELNELINNLNYLTYVFDDTSKKLIKYSGAYVESNYILIHKNNTVKFKDTISN